MKDQKNKSWEFHGFASNPAKSFEAGKKGNRLAIENSLRESSSSSSSSSNPVAESRTSKTSSQGKQSKGWQSVKGSKKDKGSSEE